MAIKFEGGAVCAFITHMGKTKNMMKKIRFIKLNYAGKISNPLISQKLKQK
jgi:hypothetical protein